MHYRRDPPVPALPATSSPAVPVSLDDCEREPIHIPGCVQPHGALAAFEPTSGVLLYTSGNLGRVLPAGRSLADLVGDTARMRLQQVPPGTAGGGVQPRFVDLPTRPDAGQPQALQALVHHHRGVCVVEFEPAPTSEHDWLQRVGDTVSALRSATEINDLVDRVARQVKRLTGMDRVMVYRFDADWHGQVIADAREDDMESYHDLHYPASDIPAQARELYRSNLVRYIADVDYTPVPVTPLRERERHEPLDMSHCSLRSVSPIHLQYLRNMGVASSLTLSLLVDGRLWGLIACHHRQPTALPLRLRLACHSLAIGVGYMLGWNEQRNAAIATAQLMQVQNRILETFTEVQAPLAAALEHSAADLLRIAGASSGAFWHGDEVLGFGPWPGGDRGASVVRQARQALGSSSEDVFSTEHAELTPPLRHDEMRVACGLMAVRLDPFASAGLVWLRPELRREVAWGGDPDRPAQLRADTAGHLQLTPRASFARWETLVQGRCRPWSEVDRRAAVSLLPLRQALVLRESLAQVSFSDQRFRALVGLQSEAYWQLDAAGRMVTLSRPLPTGHGPIEGQTLIELLQPDCEPASLATLQRALQAARPFRNVRVHGLRRTPAHPRIELLFGGEPMRDRNGVVVGWHGLVSDITHESAVHQALMQKEVAESANRAKSKFLSQVSHELRTPLNAVLGFSELLQHDSSLGEAQRQQAGHIHRAGQWLLAMISDLLDLSRSETGSLGLEMGAVDVAQVLAEVQDLVCDAARAAQVRLVPPEATGPVWVQGDARRLKQVLVNLASNAVKYNRPAGEVRFAIVRDAAAKRTRIEVHDTGMGLNEAQVERLFEPFNRLGRENQQIQGTGIGLVIARQLIGAMAGSIVVKSQPGRGSCFTVMLANAEAPVPA